MRPSTMWGFAVGLMVGSLSIATAAMFSTAGAEQLPACETVKVEYAVAR
jgi:hypothetical protein